MNDELLGWLLGLAITVVPVAVATWWGVRARRRDLPLVLLKVSADASKFTASIRQATEAMARFAEVDSDWRRLDEIRRRAVDRAHR